MNSLNFEDTVFISNMRIRMIRDTLRLNPPPELFLEKTLDDLEFIDHIHAVLATALKEKNGQLSGNGEYDSLSDAEWQYSQLLTEILSNSGPFFPQATPEIRQKIYALRENNNIRRQTLFESGPAAENVQADPVVSPAELSGLLGGI